VIAMLPTAASRGFVLGGLAALLLAVAFAPVLAFGADTMASPPAPTGPAVAPPLMIPAAAFRSDGFVPGGVEFNFGFGDLRGNGTPPPCVMAPVYLPRNAVMSHMYASVYDNDTNWSVTVHLWRVNNYTGVVDTLAQAGTTVTSTAIQTVSDLSVDYPVVTYPDYAYYVTTCLRTAQTGLYSVRIYYDRYNVFLPAILRAN
jgi:hypothetical protein